MNICDLCIREDKEIVCPMCTRNPSNVLADFFVEYYPVCNKGYVDCIHDPAYIKHFYPDWYEDLYGNMLPEEAIHAEGGCCDKVAKDPDENYYCYDDEDK